MAAKTTYIATAPDGSVHTRTTARTYEYAVLIHVTDGWNNPEPHWGHVGFAGRYDLAAKVAKQWAGYSKLIEAPLIVPAIKKEK
jgi:hypothetical protein